MENLRPGPWQPSKWPLVLARFGIGKYHCNLLPTGLRMRYTHVFSTSPMAITRNFLASGVQKAVLLSESCHEVLAFL